MKAQSHLWLWQFGSYLRYGMLSSCICNTLVSVCAMKGIPIGPLAQWGKHLTYYLTPFFCLVNWGMHYPGSACRGTDLPSGRLLYIHTHLGFSCWKLLKINMCVSNLSCLVTVLWPVKNPRGVYKMSHGVGVSYSILTIEKRNYSVLFGLRQRS